MIYAILWEPWKIPSLPIVAQFEQTNYLEDLLQDLPKVQSTRENEEYQLTSTDYPWDVQQQEDKDEDEEGNVT